MRLQPLDFDCFAPMFDPVGLQFASHDLLMRFLHGKGQYMMVIEW